MRCKLIVPNPPRPGPAALRRAAAGGLLVMLLLFPAAFAASVQLDLHASPLPDRTAAVQRLLQGAVQLDDLPLPGGRAALGVAWSGGLGASLYLRQTTSLGPVGNVILELQAGGSTSGSYRSSFTARGVAGPVAVRFRLSALNDPDLLLAGPGSSAFPVPPQLAGAQLGLQLGATWRPSSSLLLDVDSAVFAAAVTGYTLAAEARLLRQADGHDLIMGFDGYLQAGAAGPVGSGALRIGRQFNQRRAAPWQVHLLFGAGPGYVGPGLRVSGARQFSGAELTVVAAAEFYRLDAAPLQLSVQWQQPLDANGSRLTGGAELNWSAAAGAAAQLRVGYRMPLEW